MCDGKNKPKFSGCTLIIQAPLTVLPFERWTAILADLHTEAAGLPFQEIHVIGTADEEPKGFQIK